MRMMKLEVCGPGFFIVSPSVARVGVDLFVYLIGLSSEKHSYY
jgi:hypothetical protein